MTPNGCDQGSGAGPTRTLHRLSELLSISAAMSSGDEIRELAERGFSGLVDLRSAGEPVTGLPPAEERRIAEAHGLSYQRIPVSVRSLGPRTIDDVCRALAAAETPLLVHCGSGRRAAVCVLIHLGCDQGWTVDQCLAVAREHGIEIQAMARLRDCLSVYIRGHSRAYANSAAPGLDPVQVSYQI